MSFSDKIIFYDMNVTITTVCPKCNIKIGMSVEHNEKIDWQKQKRDFETVGGAIWSAIKMCDSEHDVLSGKFMTNAINKSLKTKI